MKPPSYRFNVASYVAPSNSSAGPSRVASRRTTGPRAYSAANPPAHAARGFFGEINRDARDREPSQRFTGGRAIARLANRVLVRLVRARELDVAHVEQGELGRRRPAFRHEDDARADVERARAHRTETVPRSSELEREAELGRVRSDEKRVRLTEAVQVGHHVLGEDVRVIDPHRVVELARRVRIEDIEREASRRTAKWVPNVPPRPAMLSGAGETEMPPVVDASQSA